jgi:hypothetical protein
MTHKDYESDANLSVSVNFGSEKPLKVKVSYISKYGYEVSKLPVQSIFSGFIRKWHTKVICYKDLKPLIKALNMKPSEAVGVMESLWNEGILIKLCPKRYRKSPFPNWKSRYRGRRYINQPRPTLDESRIIKIAGIKEKDIPNWQCALDMVGIWRYYRERFYKEPKTDVARDIKRQGYPEYVLKGLRWIYKEVTPLQNHTLLTSEIANFEM